MSVTVLGSLNADLSFRCEAMPSPGETVLCKTYAIGPGGKGLNQAVAARRAGSDVLIEGAIGSDAFGDMLKAFLQDEGIDCTRIARCADLPTGVAHIVVDAAGENAIVVASGANAVITSFEDTGSKSRVRLAQLETPVSAILEFMRSGREQGAVCILNAAPAIHAALEIFPYCNLIVVNEHELAEFAGISIDLTDRTSLRRAASVLVDLEAQSLIVTLGAEGCCLFGPAGDHFIAPRLVAVKDTTGAGDCFCGVLADGIARGLDLIAAAGRANIAASLAVQRTGAAIAMPFGNEL